MKQKKISILLLSIITTVCLSGCDFGSDAQIQYTLSDSQTVSTSESPTNMTMPGFKLQLIDNDSYYSSDSLNDKAVYITFFTFWCRACVEEMETLIRVQNSYADRKFTVIGISVEKENRSMVLKMIRKAEVIYPVLLSNGQIEKRFGGISIIPTAFLIDQKGKVIKKYFGPPKESTLRKDIEKILL